MVCFYHNDADGHCAGFWVSLSAGITDLEKYKPRFFEVNYSEPFPFQFIHKDEQVYIVDYSINPDEMLRLLEITKDVTWIDHHITAIEKYKDFPYEIRGVRYNGIAGCMLTYCYLHHMTDRGFGPIKPFDEEMTKDAPYFTKLIADWDVWRFAYGTDTRNFITAFNAEDTHPENPFWERMVRDYSSGHPKLVDDMIKRGGIMLRYRDGFMESYCDIGFEVEFEGYRCFALNIAHANSEFFKSVAYRNYDIYMPFSFNGTKWTVSMYANSDNANVSKIAVKYGGGGHVKAAGFTCDKLPFIST